MAASASMATRSYLTSNVGSSLRAVKRHGVKEFSTTSGDSLMKSRVYKTKTRNLSMLTCSQKESSDKPVSHTRTVEVVLSGLMALAISTAEPQQAFADVGFQTMKEQNTIVILADADTADTLTAPLIDEANNRALKLKDLFAQKKIEAQEKIAAAKAESEAIAKKTIADFSQTETKPEPAPTQSQKAEPEVPPPPVVESRPEAPAPKETPASALVPVSKTKTHGNMPLFLAEFLVFAAYAGGIVAIVKVPSSVWTSVSEKVDAVVGIVYPKVEDAWKTAEPIVSKGVKVTQKFANDAKPYVVKAAEAAKPAALQAIEASKPLVKKGQEKLTDLVAEAQAKIKN